MSYRVFISYSHEDEARVRQIIDLLKANGLTVLWDQDFAFGHGFHEQIESFIAYSHVFLPVITPNSSQRGWVHQEIGYARGLNIPVLPLALGALPGQMIEQLHAIRAHEDAPEQWQRDLALATFERLVGDSAESAPAPFLCAPEQEQRSALITKYAREVLALKHHGRVRHRGGHSVFSVPDKPLANRLWKERNEGKTRANFANGLLRDERVTLGQHAAEAGCSLILNLSGTFDQFKPIARRSRLGVLRAYLAAARDEDTIVAIDNTIPHGENQLLLGDWFVAMAMSSIQGSGYRQTILSRHAPTMRSRVEAFDATLDDLLAESGTPPAKSREAAIRALDELIATLPEI